MTQSMPFLNPADGSTPEGILDHLLRQFGLDLAVRLPGRVVSYDRNTNMVTVQPEPGMTTTLNQKVPRATLTMTALTMFGGGFIFNFPLQAGDTGHIVAFDRDISLFRQSLSAANANTNRAHAWEDSVFVPDKFRDFTIDGEDDGCVVLQSLDGETKISVGHGKIHLKATEVTIDSEAVTVNAAALCEINAPLTAVKGELNVTGGITGGGGATMTGGITNTGGDIVSDGISLETHVHGGIQSGGSDTGEPK